VVELEDAITFECEKCLYELGVSTTLLNDHARFICSECGADYGTWQEIKARLLKLLSGQQNCNEDENLEQIDADDRMRPN
jgi:hypothetical protein